MLKGQFFLIGKLCNRTELQQNLCTFYNKAPHFASRAELSNNPQTTATKIRLLQTAANWKITIMKEKIKHVGWQPKTWISAILEAILQCHTLGDLHKQCSRTKCPQNTSLLMTRKCDYNTGARKEDVMHGIVAFLSSTWPVQRGIALKSGMEMLTPHELSLR